MYPDHACILSSFFLFQHFLIFACMHATLYLSPSLVMCYLFLILFSLSPATFYDALERETPQSKKNHHQKRKKEKVTPFIQFLESEFSSRDPFLPHLSFFSPTTWSSSTILLSLYLSRVLQGLKFMCVFNSSLFSLLQIQMQICYLLYIIHTWTFYSFSMCFIFLSKSNVFCCSRKYDFCMKILHYVPQ